MWPASPEAGEAPARAASGPDQAYPRTRSLAHLRPGAIPGDRAEHGEPDHRHGPEPGHQPRHGTDEDGLPVPVDPEGTPRPAPMANPKAAMNGRPASALWRSAKSAEDHGEDEAAGAAERRAREALVGQAGEPAIVEGEPGEEASNGQQDAQASLAGRRE